MSCDLTQGRAFPCKDTIGGIKEVYWCVFGDLETDAITAGEISDLTSTTTLYRFVATTNSGSFNQTPTTSMENGTVYYQQDLTFNLHALTADMTAELANAMKNRLTIIIRDQNDNFHLMGFENGAEANGGAINTGTAKGDLNGYTVTFMAEEKQPAPFTPDLSDRTAGTVNNVTGTITVSPE